MNSLVIAGILKRFYSQFDMNTFSNRLRLQKIVYILQASGINLGYSFSWYLHGPYCSELTRDAYQITDFSKVKEVGFEQPSIETKFEAIKTKIGDHKNNDFWLEVVSSIHFLKNLYPNKSKADIVKDIKDKCLSFKTKTNEINGIWNEIAGWLT